MKVVIGIMSVIIGIFFLVTVFFWEEADTVMAQTLKWAVTGFGISFLLGGLYAFADSHSDSEIKSLLKNLANQSAISSSSTTEPIFKNTEEPKKKNKEKSIDDFEPWKM